MGSESSQRTVREKTGLLIGSVPQRVNTTRSSIPRKLPYNVSVAAAVFILLATLASVLAVAKPSSTQSYKLIYASEGQQLAECGAYGSRSFSGLPHEPKESVVVVAMDGESEEEALGAVLRAFTDNDHANTTSAYQRFMRERRVSVTVPPALSPEDFRYDAASHERAARRALAVSALSIDVVYSYINTNSASYREAAAKYCWGPCEEVNYRDFDELRYSMRAVERFVLGSDGLASTVFEGGAGGATRAERVGRNVHLVVASADQVPAWVDRSHPRVRVVEHADTFGTFEDESVSETVPSMNSMAIETTLHRIGGLSRFYMYFNNDVIVTRPVSVFDYFRPLAPERQQLYRMFYGNGGYGDVLRSDAVLYPSVVGGGELGERESGQPRKRFAFFFESVLYSERTVRIPLKLRVDIPAELPKLCLPYMPLRVSSLLMIPPLLNFSSIPLRVQRNAREKFLDFYDGVSLNGQFPRMPHMFDRDMMTLFLDRGMRDAARETRTQRVVRESSFSAKDVYPFFMVAVRRGIERKLLLEHTQKVVKDEMNGATRETKASEENVHRALQELSAKYQSSSNVWFRRMEFGIVKSLSDLPLCGPMYPDAINNAFSPVFKNTWESLGDDFGKIWAAEAAKSGGDTFEKRFKDICLTQEDESLHASFTLRTGHAVMGAYEVKRLDDGFAPLGLEVEGVFTRNPSSEEAEAMKAVLEAASRRTGPAAWEKRT